MGRLLRWCGVGLLGVLALTVLALGVGYLWLRASLPQLDGEIRIAGLQAPVTVTRDAHAVPHIEAANWQDAVFAQGFVHAQDRLWQMEFQRRLGAGRLAEILGPAALPVDRFMRLLGMYRLAEANLNYLRPETIAWLDAYAAGVNAQLRQRTGPLPPEFQILRHFEVEPWRPADSIVWIKLLALDLSRNWHDELLRARLAKRLTSGQIDDLWPAYPASAPITLMALTDRLPLERLAAVLPSAPSSGQGSNVWAVAGTASATGAPLLANDPHLGLRAPGTWYLAHLKAPELELIGASLPGVPGIVLGHNGTIAWGFTNTGPDTQDLFVERVDPTDPDRYLTPDGSVPFETREEVIHIAGDAIERLTIRSTRHGPVLSDLVPEAAETLEQDRLLALAWTGLVPDDRSIETLFRLAQARDWSGVREATRDHGAPQQNMVYADTAGHLGFIAPGRVPIRRKGDGRWPVPGWSGDYDWQGWVPFDALPQTIDPPSNRLFNANNRIVPRNYPYLLTVDWEPPYRARRIDKLLNHGGSSGPTSGFQLEDFSSFQADQLSLLAVDLLPTMLAAAPRTEEAAAAITALRAWDRVMRADAAEPLIFAAWYRELSRLIYADELGALFDAAWNIRPQFMQRVLTTRPAWCDDVATATKETCTDLSTRALELALADLDRRFGDEPSAWRWGEAHPASMSHAVFGDQPLLAWLFDIETDSGGDSTTVNVGHYRIADPERPYAGIQAASYRGLYDLADLDRSRFVAATGQSGNPLSAHYRDLTALWANGGTISMNRDRAVYGSGAIGRLRLIP